MNAKQARRLEVGDTVIVAFGNSLREAEILHIKWPHFRVYGVLKNGEPRVQTNHYRGLHQQVEN